MVRKTVSLVLGSGGARGLAHIGVIEYLNARGYDIRSIAGTSIGAVIGGIYAAGELETYTRWVTALSRTDVLRLLDLAFSRSGLVKGDRIIGVLRKLVGDRNIEDLPVAFTAVATDVRDQKEVWLSRGPLFDAIRASIAIPTFFTPHAHGGRLLLDGGLVNPVPIAPTLKDPTDLTVAVMTGARPLPELDRAPTQTARSEEAGEYSRRIAGFIDRLRRSQGSGPQRSGVEEMGMIELLLRSTETMQNTIARLKMAAYSPDRVVEIPRNACGFLEFHRAREMIELGRREAERVLA
ncbi:MAG: patatin-like phospholipase family protein [Rhodocyclaceae bacterium]